jgi:hypothetical protein
MAERKGTVKIGRLEIENGRQSINTFYFHSTELIDTTLNGSIN